MNKKILSIIIVFFVTFSISLFSMEKSPLPNRMHHNQKHAEKSWAIVQKYLVFACEIFLIHIDGATKTRKFFLNKSRMNYMYDIDDEIGRLLDEKTQAEWLTREASCTIYPTDTNELIFYSEKPYFNNLLQQTQKIYENRIKQLTAIKNFLAEPTQSYYTLYPNSDSFLDRIDHWKKASSVAWLLERHRILELLITQERFDVAHAYVNQLLKILKSSLNLLYNDYDKTHSTDSTVLKKKIAQFSRTKKKLKKVQANLSEKAYVQRTCPRAKPAFESSQILHRTKISTSV